MALSFVMLVCIVCNARGQGFTQVYPNTLITDYTGLIRWNGDTLYACGVNAVIVQSTDAGATWTRILESLGGYDFVGMGRNETGIYLLPEATYSTASLFANADSMFILRYSPWSGEVTRVSAPLVSACYPVFHSAEYRSMQVIDEGIFLLTSSVWGMSIPCTRFLFSANGGESWEEVSLPDSVLNRDATFNFRNRDHGFLLAYYGFEKLKPSLFRTSDGGRQWKECFPSKNGVNFIGPMQWISDSTFAIATDEGCIELSSDFGASWSRLPPPPCAIATFAFTDTSIAYVVAKAGPFSSIAGIFKTIDDGKSWTNINADESMKSFNVPRICVLGMDSLVFAGWDGFQYRTMDGGLTWDYASYEPKRDFSDIRFVSPDVGFARAYDLRIGYDTWFRTENGGHTWHNLGADQIPRWLQLHPVDASVVWAFYPYTNLLNPTNALDSLIYLSEDGGNFWTPKYIVNVTDSIHLIMSGNLHPACGKDSLMVMTNKGIVRTLDRGARWELCPQVLSIVSPKSLKAVATTLYGDNNAQQWWQGPDRVVVSNDYGKTWQVSLSLSDSAVRLSSAFKSLYASGNYVRVASIEYSSGPSARHDILYRSEDGGRTWTAGDVTFSYGQVDWTRMLDNTFASGDGYALGVSAANWYANESVVYKTTDDWKYAAVATHLSKLGSGNGCLLQFINENTGWLVSTNIIYRTTNGGIDWVQMPVAAPHSVELEQNYPNPFTSETSTMITYTVVGDKPVQVTIDVTDVMGRRVRPQYTAAATPGRHAITWNAAGIAPGIYFARLTARGEMRVRKMVVK